MLFWHCRSCLALSNLNKLIKSHCLTTTYKRNQISSPSPTTRRRGIENQKKKKERKKTEIRLLIFFSTFSTLSLLQIEKKRNGTHIGIVKETIFVKWFVWIHLSPKYHILRARCKCCYITQS